MSDIPLFYRSKIFSDNLHKALKPLKLSKYGVIKSVNFLHKFDSLFLESQQKLFMKDPDGYLLGKGSTFRYSDLNEFFNKKVPNAILLKTILKYFAHRMFHIIGKILNHPKRERTIRKCYVEDVEGLFESNDNIIRIIFPFPLNIYRQFRYVRNLMKNKHQFVLSGFHYSFNDFFVFLIKRDYRALMRLEVRASLRDAIAHFDKYKPEVIECSDEYDIGSYFYAKRLKRKKEVKVINSAHGVSTYLPYQRYDKFLVLTSEQKRFYGAYNPTLVFEHREIRRKKVLKCYESRSPLIVLLGQYSAISGEQIKLDELEMLRILNEKAIDHPNLEFVYKPHPNNESFRIGEYSNIQVKQDMQLNSENLLQFSLFSTCQIDPNFSGSKYLVETTYIKPQFVFGEQEPVVNIKLLPDFIDNWAHNLKEN